MHILWSIGGDIGALILQMPPVILLWRHISTWLHMEHVMSTYRRMFRIFKMHYYGTRDLVMARHLAIVPMKHHVWLARNRIVHEGEKIDVEQMFQRIQVHALGP